MANQSFIEKIYKDKHGKVTLVQKPNLPIIVWFVSLILAKLFGSGMEHNLFSIISFGAIFTWAWLELFQGSNYLRRLLGLIILVIAIKSRV